MTQQISILDLISDQDEDDDKDFELGSACSLEDEACEACQ